MHSIDNTSETHCVVCAVNPPRQYRMHNVIGCRKLAQEEYRKRHDEVALQVHWKLYRKCGLECKYSGMTINPYQLQRIEKLENLRYDYLTDKRLYKDRQEWTIIDIALQADWTKISTEPRE